MINRLNADGINRWPLPRTGRFDCIDGGGRDDGRPITISRSTRSRTRRFPCRGPERRGPNWFHLAREFTERWHHQQQIRLATERDGIMTRELYHPVLECFMRALPFAFRDKHRDARHVRARQRRR